MKGQPRKKSKTASKKSFKRVLRSFKRAASKIKSPTLLKRKSQVPVNSQIAAGEPMNTAPSFTPDTRVPERYGENKMVLLVRDPWWIYAYWEVTPEKQKEVEGRLHREGLKSKETVLRVYDVTGVSFSRPNSFFDIELRFFADNWYIDAGRPGRDWVAEIGLRAEDGRFFALVRSNTVRMPPFGISDVLDEEWMLPEDIYYRILGPAGIRGGLSSLEIRKMLERHLRAGVSSKILTDFPGRNPVLTK